MRKQLLMLLILSPLTLTLYAQTSPASTSQTSSDAEVIEQLEKDLIKAYNTGDTQIIERIVANDATRGLNKTALILHKKPYDADAFEMGRPVVSVWENTAVATGTMTVSSKEPNQTTSRYYRVTDTFIKRKNTWQLVASSRAEVSVWQTREMKNTELTDLTALDCSGEATAKSLNSNTAAFIKFTNGTSKPITIRWINREGKPDPRFTWTLTPGNSYPMQTYLTHPFIVTDEIGKCLGLYTAKKEPGLVVVK
ncbi:DUF4440 domain-containing protein [Spirosoma sp. BT702]|uniref:DUF4440 domain-containing protein n=1 Tax=Spirosoma profusum TaxID=2771354 RepID=A0A927AVA3_9BACT|nr:DUF4440 domain-containing protein [Spirosoma profusum]MBD2705073.1 DUF4440 domain-containing protein [Spirosoma profusum]